MGEIPAANVVGEYVQGDTLYWVRASIRDQVEVSYRVQIVVSDGWIEDPYPEHTRQAKALDDAQLQGELLEWMQENGYFVCVRLPGICARCGAVWPEGEVFCAGCWASKLYLDDRHQLVPAGKDINQLLAEFHGIDLAKIEEEKRAILASLRKERK